MSNLFSFFRRRRLNAELDEEIRSHLAIETRQREEAGESLEQARLSAQRDFGNAALVKEVTRDMWGFQSLEQIGQDLRYAARTLRKSPGFTLLAVAALTLGIGATTAIFTVVHSVLLRSLSFPEAERLVMVWERIPNSNRNNVVAMPNFLAWKERNRTFSSMAAFHQQPMNLLGGDAPEQVTGIAATADFFRVLGVAPVLGRTFATEEDGPSAPRLVVLSHGLWQRRFGGRTDVIGQKISINVAHHEIIGVMPPAFAFPDRRAELFIAVRNRQDNGRNYSTVARLRPGVTLGAAQGEMTAIATQTAVENPRLNSQWSATVVPLHEQTVGQLKPILLVLFAAVGFVLLIACANVANLVLMRSAGRTREMSIRTALGAGRARLLRQLTVESLLLANLGGLLGVALAYSGVRSLVLMLPATFPLPRLDEIRMDVPVLLFTMFVTLSAGVLFGLAPAFQFNRQNLARGLHQSGRSIAASHGLRRVLVVAEVALALVLLTGAGLMIRSFARLSQVEPGFHPERVLTLRMLLLPVRDRAAHAEVVNDVLQRIRALPQVVAAGSINNLPMTGGNSGSWYYRADQPEPPLGERPGGDVSIITPGYFQALGIPLLKGRGFDERDRIGSPKVAILNQTAARMFFKDEDPLGKRLTVSWNDAREVQVVGVVADIRHSQLHTPPDPCLFMPNAQQPFPFSALVVRTTGEPLSLVAAVKEQIRQVDSDQGVAQIETMEQLVADSIARPRLQTLLVALFGSLALTLACIGIYGVISYSVTQRTREIGIRLALGAARPSVFGMVLKEGLHLMFLGLVIGLAAALAMTRYLQKLLYAVEPADPVVFACMTALLVLVAAVACYVPASRATRVDPAMVLREE